MMPMEWSTSTRPAKEELQAICRSTVAGVPPVDQYAVDAVDRVKNLRQYTRKSSQARRE